MKMKWLHHYKSIVNHQLQTTVIYVRGKCATYEEISQWNFALSTTKFQVIQQNVHTFLFQDTTQVITIYINCHLFGNSAKHANLTKQLVSYALPTTDAKLLRKQIGSYFKKTNHKFPPSNRELHTMLGIAQSTTTVDR